MGTRSGKRRPESGEPGRREAESNMKKPVFPVFGPFWCRLEPVERQYIELEGRSDRRANNDAPLCVSA